jgi:uncharacterized protein YdbL (DUF1318 family)
MIKIPFTSLVAKSLAAIALCLMLAGTAHADALNDARAAGLVGERPDGYLDSVAPSPTPEIRSLIDQVNAIRRSDFQRIGGQKGVPPEEVGALVAEETIKKLKPGMYYMNSSGQWVQK